MAWKAIIITLCVLSMIALYSGVMHCGRVLGSVYRAIVALCTHYVHIQVYNSGN